MVFFFLSVHIVCSKAGYLLAYKRVMCCPFCACVPLSFIFLLFMRLGYLLHVLCHIFFLFLCFLPTLSCNHYFLFWPTTVCSFCFYFGHILSPQTLARRFAVRRSSAVLFFVIFAFMSCLQSKITFCVSLRLISFSAIACTLSQFLCISF